MYTPIIAGMIGPQEVLIILVLVVLMFGGRKIPELMKGLGKGMKEFKKASSEDSDDDMDKMGPGKNTGQITE